MRCHWHLCVTLGNCHDTLPLTHTIICYHKSASCNSDTMSAASKCLSLQCSTCCTAGDCRSCCHADTTACCCSIIYGRTSIPKHPLSLAGAVQVGPNAYVFFRSTVLRLTVSRLTLFRPPKTINSKFTCRQCCPRLSRIGHDKALTNTKCFYCWCPSILTPLASKLKW